MGNHFEILSAGTGEWNRWRAANQGVRPQLSGADLSEMDLAGIDLSGADLSEAELCDADLAGANLKMADLAGSDLSGAVLKGASLYKGKLAGASLIGADLSGTDLGAADLERADLRGTSLKGSNLMEAGLRSANLNEADLSGANLNNADVTGASFKFATLANANITGLSYGSFRSMRGRYHGIKGLGSCYGNALFVRDSQDQDYLDSLEHRIGETSPPLLRAWKSFWFSMWGLIDYGRSLVKPAGYAIMVAALFGLVYLMDIQRWVFCSPFWPTRWHGGARKRNRSSGSPGISIRRNPVHPDRYPGHRRTTCSGR